MDLNLISVFVGVVEAGSFTAAAAALGLPKSSVSRSIARLESELGVRLLQRTTRSLSLTDAGRAYHDRIRGAVAHLAEASCEIADLGQEPRGLVRLSAPGDAADLMLPSMLASFLAIHPQVRLQVSLSSRHVDLVAEGFDLAIRVTQHMADSSLIARKIGVFDGGLFAASSYLARRGEPNTVADLVDHDFVLFRARERTTLRLEGPAGIEHVEVTGPMTVDEMRFAFRTVSAGLGIGLLPVIQCIEDTEAGRLVRVLPEYAHREAALYVVSPPMKYVPAAVALLREHLVRELTALMNRGHDGCAKPSTTGPSPRAGGRASRRRAL